MKKLAIAAAFAAVAMATPALADGHEAKVQAYLDSDVSKWIFSGELINAVAQQNIDHYGITEAEIDRLDQRVAQRTRARRRQPCFIHHGQ